MSGGGGGCGGGGYELKRLSPAGVAAALDKAERYRLLNEPHEAESICLDVLAVEPANARASAMLVLALSDQLGGDLGRFDQAMELAGKLGSDYERAYYRGILCERRAKAHHRGDAHHAGHIAYHWYRRAMEHYETAERLRPPGNDDAILRWNTCARLLMRHPELVAGADERDQTLLE